MPTVQVLNALAINLLDGVAHSVQNGATFALPVKPGVASWQIVYGSAPAGSTVLLQISNDGTNWTTVDTSTVTTGELRQLSTLTGIFVRARIDAAAGGSTTTVILVYKGFDLKLSSQAELLFSSSRQNANVGAGLETLQSFFVPSGKVANNGDALVIMAAVQIAANANSKTSALGGQGVTLASRGATDNNLPRTHWCRVVRTGPSASQNYGISECQGQGTLVTLSVGAQSWATSLEFTLVAIGVAANDVISRDFRIWYEPVQGTYVGL